MSTSALLRLAHLLELTTQPIFFIYYKIYNFHPLPPTLFYSSLMSSITLSPR